MTLKTTTHILDCPIYWAKSESFFSQLNDFIQTAFADSKKIILLDNNTLQHCYPILQKHCSGLLKNVEIIEVESGEQSKSLDICKHIWQTLADMNVDRNALLINLGGGMVCDLGGFIASVYKRGIPFINIPTTVLAQTDAAIGGKNGIDFISIKNLLGTINQPKAVFVSSCFLNTLPKKEVLSGFAEMLKHGLIADENYWRKLIGFAENGFNNWDEIIAHSIGIKAKIVNKDPRENNERKLLNFGHSIGHAIEAFALKKEKPVLHGEAVAIGMLCESYISYKLKYLPHEALDEIWGIISLYYKPYLFTVGDIPQIIGFIRNDKKNMSGKLNFSLISAIGKGEINFEVPEKTIVESLRFYLQKTDLEKPVYHS